MCFCLELFCRDFPAVSDTPSDGVLVDAGRNKSAGRFKHTHMCDMQSGSERNTDSRGHSPDGPVPRNYDKVLKRKEQESNAEKQLPLNFHGLSA